MICVYVVVRILRTYLDVFDLMLQLRRPRIKYKLYSHVVKVDGRGHGNFDADCLYQWIV